MGQELIHFFQSLWKASPPRLFYSLAERCTGSFLSGIRTFQSTEFSQCKKSVVHPDIFRLSLFCLSEIHKDMSMVENINKVWETQWKEEKEKAKLSFRAVLTDQKFCGDSLGWKSTAKLTPENKAPWGCQYAKVTYCISMLNYNKLTTCSSYLWY